MKYDYLIVGAGLYGAVLAERLTTAGKRVLVVEKRDHIAGNVFTEQIEGIQVHKYGAHIFHTNEKDAWTYLNQFTEFNRFTNSPVANYHGELFSLPFNMYTFNRMWGCVTPQEAMEIIQLQRQQAGISDPKNLEEQAISLIGVDLYETLVKGYTEKQWGRSCKELPAFIIKRLPVRFSFDNNYFNARYQGIPIGGYTAMVEKMLNNVDLQLGLDFLTNKDYLLKQAKRIVYTGAIDAYFDYRFGPLAYRSLRFETQVLDTPNYQGNAVVNYTDRETPYTRIIEHKWFDYVDSPKTVITREYSVEWKPGEEPFYPVNNQCNQQIFAKYRELAEGESCCRFGGRLGEYKYYDMDTVVLNALRAAEEEIIKSL